MSCCCDTNLGVEAAGRRLAGGGEDGGRVVLAWSNLGANFGRCWEGARERGGGGGGVGEGGREKMLVVHCN